MKNMIALLSIVSFHSACLGQLQPGYGLKIGYVSSAQIVDGSSSVSSNYSLKHRSGIDVGLFVEPQVTSVLSFSAEIHYIQKGIKETYFVSEIGPSGIEETHTDYIAVPLLAKVRLSNSDVSPYVIAGPRLGVRVYTSVAGIGGGGRWSERFDTGATVGAGIEFASMAPVRLGLEFRYSPSFNDAFVETFTRVRNNAMEILLVIGK